MVNQLLNVQGLETQFKTPEGIMFFNIENETTLTSKMHPHEPSITEN